MEIKVSMDPPLQEVSLFTTVAAAAALLLIDDETVTPSSSVGTEGYLTDPRRPVREAVEGRLAEDLVI